MTQPRQHQTFCRICESLCGLTVTTQNNTVTAIRPDQSHVATHGFACPKGLKQHLLFDSPDRVTQPMIRTDTSQPYQSATWSDAYSFVSDRLNSIIHQHGPDAVAMYVGTAAGFGTLHPIFANGFMDGIGSTNMYASATQDCANKFAVAQRMYGFPFIQPYPDLRRTQCLIMVGANPMVSKWSFLQVPNPRKHINQIIERGGQVVVVDPRRTETAKAAGRHLFIKPGTDVYFYLAFLADLIQAGGVDQSIVAQHTEGFEQIKAYVSQWSAERSAAFTGINAADLRQLVQDYIQADGAALYSSTGVNMGPHGTLAFYLQEVINTVSGNLDRPGGVLVGEGIFDFARFGKKNNLLVKQDTSRIGGFKKTNDAYPGGILADEILTPGTGKIRALIVTGGNPLLTMADSDKLRAAFNELDLLVCLDILPTETAMAGHAILPCTTPLERPDLPFIFPLFLGMQTRPYLQATQAVVSPHQQVRDEATIYTDLATHLGKPLFGSRIAQWLLRLCQRKRNDDTYASVPQQGLLNLLLRITGQKSFSSLLGSGWLRPDNVGGNFLGQRVYTVADAPTDGGGRINLAAPDLLQQLNQLPTQPRVCAADEFSLITRRHVQTHNSWTHNLQEFLDRLGGRNCVYMHPSDIQALQLSESQLVTVRSTHAAISLPLSACDDLLPGVVAVPHGWGHQNSGNTIARESAGVNVNILAQSGVEHVDPVSGMSQLTDIRVSIAPTAANDTGHTWSGMT